MYNWNTDTTKLLKNKKKYAIWKLNQLINFGLNGEKIDLRSAKKYWSELSLDPKRKRFLDFVLWDKQS